MTDRELALKTLRELATTSSDAGIRLQAAMALLAESK